jgi:hypothetical protein
MAIFASTAVLDAELDYIKLNCTKIYVTSTAYTPSVTLPTAGEIIAEISVGGASSASVFTTDEFTKGAGGTANSRMLTTPANKSDTSANNTATAAHLVFCSASAVLMATTISNAQQVTATNTVNFPSVTYTVSAPTAV